MDEPIRLEVEKYVERTFPACDEYCQESNSAR